MHTDEDEKIEEETEAEQEEVQEPPKAEEKKQPPVEEVDLGNKKQANMEQQSLKIVEKGQEGPARFPQPAFFLTFKEGLHLPNIQAAIQHTYNKALQLRSQMTEQNGGANNQVVNIEEDDLMRFLKKFSLKGLLPQMPKILITTYKGNESIDTWLIAYLWGLVFVSHQEFSIFDHRKFKLFAINSYQETSAN